MSYWYINFYDKDDNRYQRFYHGTYGEAYSLVTNELARGRYEFADVCEDDPHGYVCTVDGLGMVHFDDIDKQTRMWA